jgi:hypothetical protein
MNGFYDLTPCPNKCSRFSDELDEFHYGQTIFDLNTFINSNELSISISDHLEPVKFSPSPLLKFIELTKESFGEYKISFEEDDLRSFVVEGNDLGVEKINDEIENLKILPKNGFKLNGLVNHLEDVIKKLPNSRLDDLITAISLLRELTSGALDIQIQESFYDSITPRVLQKNEKAIVVIAVGVLNFSKARNHQTFNQTINKLDESVSKSLSREMLEISSLGLFFEPLLKTPANRFRAILKSAEFFIYDINEMNLDDNLFLIKNFGEILEKILQGSEEHETRLLKLLDDSNLFPLPDIEEIDMRLIKAMNRREFKTINKIHDHVSRYFSSFEKDEFLKLFNELDSKEYEVFQISLEKNVEFNFPNSIYSAINDFVWRKAQKRETLNYELWDYLINILDGRKLKKTFTSVRDIYIKHGEISDDELYGIERGLIKHGMLAQKPNLSTSLFILPMIKSEDDTLFEAFLMSRRTLCKVISKASEAKGETVQAIEAKRKKVQGENRNQLEEVINSLT